MKNRLLAKIQQAKRARKKLFCAFLTLGYPNLKATSELIEKFEAAGTDILELGFPFSDPLADGPTIQHSSERAIEKGVRVEDSFRIVKELRRKGSEIPVIFFTYLNPILHYGLKKFVKDAKSAGFDGVIIPDMPPEEEQDFQKDCRRAGLSIVFLVAPTTEKKRAAMIAAKSNGFIYFVSLRGVTGTRKALPSDIQKGVAALRRTGKSVLIGFGVSSPDQAKALSWLSDGVIVGSAVIDELRQARGRLEPAVQFVRKMVLAVKG